jgi:hypothetical protein
VTVGDNSNTVSGGEPNAQPAKQPNQNKPPMSVWDSSSPKDTSGQMPQEGDSVWGSPPLKDPNTVDTSGTKSSAWGSSSGGQTVPGARRRLRREVGRKVPAELSTNTKTALKEARIIKSGTVPPQQLDELDAQSGTLGHIGTPSPPALEIPLWAKVLPPVADCGCKARPGGHSHRHLAKSEEDLNCSVLLAALQ